MPTIDLTDEELAAIAAALRRVIMNDRYPRAPRLWPLRAALAKLDPAAVPGQPPPLSSVTRPRNLALTGGGDRANPTLKNHPVPE